MTGVVLHFSPHPDDELLGAPATLMALRDAGYRIVNVACSLGGPEQELRRGAELAEACHLAGFELMLPQRPPATFRDEGRVVARDALYELAGEAIADLDPEIVISPTPHDRHRSHELAGSAVRDAIASLAQPPRWWMWGLWGPLALPTLGLPFDAARLEEILAALTAHRGELERNDYRRLLYGRSAMYASLGPELLFGFGATAPPEIAHLELLTEVARVKGHWLLGRSRWLDPATPLAEPSEIDAGGWLDAPSLTERLGL